MSIRNCRPRDFVGVAAVVVVVDDADELLETELDVVEEAAAVGAPHPKEISEESPEILSSRQKG